MSEREKFFWIWWEKIDGHKDAINLRMAFDAGWTAANENAALKIEQHIDADHEARAFTLAADIARGQK